MAIGYLICLIPRPKLDFSDIDDKDVLTMITMRQPPPEPKLALIHRIVLDFVKARNEDEATTIIEDAKKFNEE